MSNLFALEERAGQGGLLERRLIGRHLDNDAKAAVQAAAERTAAGGFVDAAGLQAIHRCRKFINHVGIRQEQLWVSYQRRPIVRHQSLYIYVSAPNRTVYAINLAPETENEIFSVDEENFRKTKTGTFQISLIYFWIVGSLGTSSLPDSFDI